MNKNLLPLLLLVLLSFNSCENSEGVVGSTPVFTSFNFTHNWDENPVSMNDFNIFQYVNQNGELLSIERLRYVVSDITFTGVSNERLVLNDHHFIDVTNNNGLSFTAETQIPSGIYNVSFTFGLDNEDNSRNLIDLNSESFNVPDMLGGGYHYMQFDGKFNNMNSEEQGFNYHAIRAVDNPGMNPTFPQDTFFTVNLGTITIAPNTEIEVQMNIAEWFKNPTRWDLNEFNQMLMPNSTAQIMMFQNGQNVFSLGMITEIIDN